MQVWVSVNEADIGNIHPGQPVTFTIDAFPSEVFVGEVGKVRLNATMTQNVVNYTVEVLTDNSSGKLLPYLTANVKFNVGERKNVLLVPNAALRWTPQPEQIVKEFRGQTKKGPVTESEPQGRIAPEAGKGRRTRGVLWVPEGTLVRPIYVARGLNDGSMTEVESDKLKEETPVVVGGMETQTAKGPAPGGSPFTPQLFKGAAGSKSEGGGSPQGR
jgi:HlyD family secretion protein